MSRIAAGSSDAVRISKLDPLDSDYESAWDFTKLQATKPSVTRSSFLGLLDRLFFIALWLNPGNEDIPDLRVKDIPQVTHGCRLNRLAFWFGFVHRKPNGISESACSPGLTAPSEGSAYQYWV